MCVCVCVCVLQDISKNKNLICLERVAAGHQKTIESEIPAHISNKLKNSPFQEDVLKKENPVGTNAVEMDSFVMWT